MSKVANILDEIASTITQTIGRKPTAEEMEKVFEKIAAIPQSESGPMPIFTLSTDEIFSLSAALSSKLQEMGLQGAALDRALSVGFRTLVRQIEAERFARHQQRNRLELVSSLP